MRFNDLFPRAPVTLAALLLTVPALVMAEVTVADAWVRGTVPAQRATGAFMNISVDAPTRLVGVTSTVADVTEVHEMTLSNNVMRMRRVVGIDVTPGAPLEFKPGGYHVMLIGLRQPMKAGASVELNLQFENASGKTESVPVTAVIRALTAGPMKKHDSHSGKHKHQ